METILTIQDIHQVTHDVRCIRLDKPKGYEFVPGQATDVSINKEGWKKEKRPFTFTSLTSDPYLEFTIKSYNDHDGVTKQIGLLQPGDQLIIDDSWGAIAYSGEGYFIAGGAGITPFIAILRQLQKDHSIGKNKLFFANKTSKDIIYKEELKSLLGENAIFILDIEEAGFHHGRIDQAFLEKEVDDFSRHFYICGPDPMIKSIEKIVEAKGANPEAVVFEK
ncbi:MAG: flavodoxin reductase [Niastella sp.]|nr:flavodoxin reductase [Niastella sp.]